jgi:Carboxypeptidase regulatory-like domain
MTTQRLAGALLVSAVVCLSTPATLSRAQPAASAGRATIVGYLWSADSAPIASATLRLRDLGSGRVVLTATSNQTGEFTFSAADEGTYVIEYVDESDRVVAVGSPFSVTAGETVATFVRLASRLPFGGGFFTNAAAAVVASAASIGVTAVAPTGRPVSPNR